MGNSRWGGGTRGTGHAIDLVRRPRSTGSILKPLLFARMLDAGEILPETLVPDVPSQFAGYMPENYDREFRGAVPARAALARSLNVPAVWMLQRHGVDRFYDFLRGFGMSTLHRAPDGYGLTLVLGGGGGDVVGHCPRCMRTWDGSRRVERRDRAGPRAARAPGKPGHRRGGRPGGARHRPALRTIPRLLADEPLVATQDDGVSVGARVADPSRPSSRS